MTFLTATCLLLTFFIAHTNSFLSSTRHVTRIHDWTLAANKHAFVVCGETLLKLNDDSLKSPANALIQAGNAWTTDWEDVTFACADAADAFEKLEGYGKIANELQDLSLIGGCTSVGPPSSVPNLLQLERHFQEMAKETGNKEFQIISDAFGELAAEYS